MLNIKRDKRGFMGILFFFIILFSILILGFMGVMVISVLDYASDEITPVMTDLGMAGDTNLSSASTYTFGAMDTVVQALPWVMVFVYVLALIFSMVLVVSYNYNPNPAFIGVYIALIILLIFGSIIVSNTYQDIYEGTDEIATKLQEQTAMSYLILYSPMILTLIAFFAGIYLFAGKQSEGGQV